METSARSEAAQKPKCPWHRSQRPRWNPRREARNCFRRKVRTADSSNLHKHGSSHMQQQELGMAIHKKLPACDRVDHKGYLHLRGRERAWVHARCILRIAGIEPGHQDSYFLLSVILPSAKKDAFQHLQPNGQQAENDVR